MAKAMFKSGARTQAVFQRDPISQNSGTHRYVKFAIAIARRSDPQEFALSEVERPRARHTAQKNRLDTVFNLDFGRTLN